MPPSFTRGSAAHLSKESGGHMQSIEGRKPTAGRIVGIVLNVIIDIWWFSTWGADAVFMVFVAVTIVQVIVAVRSLSKSIKVEPDGVIISGVKFPYSNIDVVVVRDGFLTEKRVIVKTSDGKKHRIPVMNPREIGDAIEHNKAQAGA